MKAKITNRIAAALLLIAVVVCPAAAWSAEQDWEILNGFTPLARSLTRLGEHYVAVPYVNRDEQLLAAVFFYAACNDRSCELQHRAGYAITNAQGSQIRLYVEPEEEELIELISVIANRYANNFQ